MLKKTITYTDFNGNEATEDFYFHLSKADLIELEVERRGGMAAWLQSIVDSEDGKAIIAEFKKLILMSYGKKSEDGKRFIKTEALRDDFMSSEAYSTLFMDLCTNPNAAAEFVNGIVPPGLEQDLAQMRSAQSPTAEGDETRKEVIAGTGHPSDTSAQTAPSASTTPPLTAAEQRERATPANPYILTQAEVIEMDTDDLKSGLATGRYKLS